MRRHRYWYTFFLLVSLGVFAIGTGWIEDDREQQKKADIQTEQAAGMQEQRKILGNVKEPESLAVEQEKSESAQLFETDQKENNAQSLKPESGPLFPEHFQEVLFIGDSRTVGLYEYGQMGEADVFADSGMTVFNLWDSGISLHDTGKKTLEQILAENHYQIIHVMLGINELGYSMEQIVEKYRETVEKIQDMQPDAKVVLGANLHVTAENSAKSTIYNNQRINELNLEIQKIGAELDCYYINVNEIFDDAQGNLLKEYSTDGSHVLGKYYADWVRWILDRKSGLLSADG